MTDPITHRRILRTALPVVLSNATVPILGAVDTGVVGQIAQAEPIAAVGAGAIVLTAVYWIFGFLRMGTAGLTAQAMGADDKPEMGALLIRALLIGFAAGLIFILGQAVLFNAAFALSPASAEVEALARSYMGIRIWSAPAIIALYGVQGWLVGQERTWAMLLIQLWMNGLNIILDLWFVLGLGWGVEGVAFATFLAEWSGLALALWLARDAFRLPGWASPRRLFDATRLRTMALVNTDIMLRSVLLQIAFTSFLLVYSADQGTVVLAANQVLLQFMYITAYALDGFAFSAEALVGQAFGMKNPMRLRRATLMTTGWGIITVCLLACAFALGGGPLIDIMSKSPEVQDAARTFLPWVVAAPLIGVTSWMMDGVFIGATRTRDMRNMMLISFSIYLLAVYAFSPWGNHGLWAALMIFFAARGITLLARYPALERASVA